jgi:hypothetical protein
MAESVPLTALWGIVPSDRKGRGGPRPASERTLLRLAETTMPNPPLPVEILDYVVNYLHDTEDALGDCCLVSKSWIPRARKHLFANIAFPTVESLQSWKKKFPDPSTSPARYAKTLFIDCAAPSAEAGSWIRGFSRIVRLEVGTYLDLDEPVISLVPFHGLSPVLKSLRVTAPALPPSCIFDLFLSFPLLEDLAVTTHGMWVRHNDNSKEDEMPTNPQPSSPPVLTGSLKLDLFGGMKPITSRLLSLPGGIRFRELTLTWLHKEDLSTTTRLVEECSHTLESLDITWSLGKLIRHLRPH